MSGGIEAEFMDRAFELAKEALSEFEVPVGCVFVRNNRVIGEGRNEVNATKNATRHAEMVAIDRIINDLETDPDKERLVKDLWTEVSLYVTVEPCVMCASALHQLGIKRVVFGCRNQKFGGMGSVYNIPKVYGASMEVVEGIRAADAVKLLQDFYETENPFVPPALKKPRQTKRKEPDTAGSSSS